MPLAPSRLVRFANDCLEVQLQANCRERDVFLIQPLVPPVQEHLVELLLMLDAARGASAARITVVMPHYAYARSDKKDAPRISIGGRLVADLMVAAGADRVLAMTLHSPQVHGFFSIPVDHLHALRELAEHFRRYDLADTVVVSPDLGNAKEAAAFARMLGRAGGGRRQAAVRRRPGGDQLGHRRGGGPRRDRARRRDRQGQHRDRAAGAARASEASAPIRVACTHGLFADGALERIGEQPDVVEIVCTNTVPMPADQPRRSCTVLVGRPGAGRGDAPHPQRRVGQRPVPRSLTAVARWTTLSTLHRIAM